ncbi:MAG: ribonuclease D [Desulfoarculaceae bacterium]|nr:ribonuclease D [Desulfoarculaceae bacterium]
MITNQKDLQALIRRARATDAVALDTEFFWERTYYPKLGLIQLALSSEECFLIDPCALSDLSALGELLGDPTVVKIFHDAPQDLSILYQATGVLPRTIFDTRLAAGFAGISSTISLGNLIKELLDIELPKTETRTNWLRRPLNQKQIEYALDDVRYLRALRVLLLSGILGPEIKGWLDEELERYDDPNYYEPPVDENRYLKIKGAGNLNRQALASLQELAGWREQEARKRNRPRGHIITDQALLYLATNQILSPEKMEQSKLITNRTIDQYGQQFIALIKKGLLCPEQNCPPSLHTAKLNKTEQEELKRLQKYITLKSDALSLDPSLICNNSELRALIRFQGQPDKIYPRRLASGWRHEFLAEMF